MSVQLSNLVTRDPEILGGTPVFTGTRVPVDTLWSHVKAGDTLDTFLEDFPTVTRSQAEAAIDLAADLILAESSHESSS